MFNFITIFCMMGLLMSPWTSGMDANRQPMGDPISRSGDEDHGGVYLSVIVAGRHDNLRGNTTARLQNALDFYLVQGSALEVSMEFIVVEWNPLPAEARLKDVLKVPPGCSIPVRVITVDSEFHSRVSAGTGQSFFNDIARNVGARRSRGQFVLFTNGDDLVNMYVMRVFGAKGLDPCSFYRMRRNDIDWVSPEGAPSMTIFQKIDHVDDETNLEGKPGSGIECSKATALCPGNYNVGICEALGEGSASPIAADHQGLHDELYTHAPGDFFLASRDAIHALGGYHQVPSTTMIDSLLLCKARGAGMRQVVLVWPCLLLHERHPVSDKKPFVLPGWELTPELCERVSDEARHFLQDSLGMSAATKPDDPLCLATSASDGLLCGGKCEWGGRSMNTEWGYPEEIFEEDVLRVEHGPDYFESVTEPPR